jgi:hypothetical protein
MKLSRQNWPDAAVADRSLARTTSTCLLAVTLIAGTSIAFGKGGTPRSAGDIPLIGEMVVTGSPRADAEVIADLGSMTVTASREVVFAGKDSLRRPAG